MAEDEAPEPQPKRAQSNPLARKAGPFTIGVWVALLAGGVILGTYLKSKRKPPASDAAAAPAPDVTASPSGTVTLSDRAINLPAPSSGPSTNLAWLNNALNQLVAQGQDPALVQAALSKFLNGQPLTPQERAILALALKLVGPPPEGAPPNVGTDIAELPTPSTPTTPAPPPGSPSSTPAAPGPPVDAYANADNLTLVETANALLYKPNNEPDFSAMRDSLAVRVRDGKLCSADPAWFEAQNKGMPLLLIHDHVFARMSQLGWTPKC